MAKVVERTGQSEKECGLSSSEYDEIAQDIRFHTAHMLTSLKGS